MARVRLPLQIALATVAAVLSLYLWLRAIGGDPGVSSLRSPVPLATDRIVARFDTPRRLRPHVRRLHERRDSAVAGSRLALAPTAAVRPVAAAAPSGGGSGGGGSAAAGAPGSSSPPPPPPPPPSPPPPPPPPAVASPSAPSDTSTKPGWGCGDTNHTHTGPPGKGGDKDSPC